MNSSDAIARARALLAQGKRRTLSLPERGVDIALHDWGGDGPLALLHHANGFCKGALALLAECLSAHYHVVAMDARGHGDSSRPEGADAYHWDAFALDALHVARALSAERGARVALGFGHSFGGTSLIGAAARAPELFERLVLLDPVTPSSQHATPEHSARNRKLVEGAQRRRAHWDSVEEAFAWWSQRSLFANFHPVALALYALDGLRAVGGDAEEGFELKCAGAVEAAVFQNARTANVAEHARGLACKTHWLWACQGDFERKTYEALAATMPHADITDLDAGHLVAMENPTLILQTLQKLGIPC